MKSIQIAIDGPASSGKSTVAKIIAKIFDYTYLDTGAMYRAATYLALQYQVAQEDSAAIVALLDQFPIGFGRNENGEQLVFVGDVDITHAIRENQVTNNVSWVSALAPIREKLVDLQRKIAEQGGIVMDGRDIGTVVLPDAELKIFLIASVEERALRRFKENKEKGIPTDLECLKEEIALRDHRDSTRSVSPLKAADDAIIFDTTGVSIEGVVEFISKKVKEILDK
ncbi:MULTISPECIES: (d)CMP kinase [unclassified Streptococcus]|uniref:(d)CMP kinase n=1 Tax=unclassified Streptococcus TaxID=2608887 RepID=UPI00107180C0|nr:MULTISPECIES: (d)CMP kinase [unclassified Streptococcus]MBF0786600.1 (d)CMP kinase [Streptococcus sp. 19428wC2_LYSM12]MCQ9210907.1 (d)CMP kinase [Streptococcus sp. B01]MCQ9214176.1 (d)CMP kinase [Streptococcus sp. O1]TFV06561.1 (d)CMP kinase [Streptococcus sp. LYSM12]